MNDKKFTSLTELFYIEQFGVKPSHTQSLWGDTVIRFAESFARRLLDNNSNPSVLTEVDLEMRKQIDKWGQQNHHPYIWQNILMEEVGEVSKAILQTEMEGKKKTWDDVREELVQVAAVACSAIQSIDRNQIEVKNL